MAISPWNWHICIDNRQSCPRSQDPPHCRHQSKSLTATMKILDYFNDAELIRQQTERFANK